MRVVKKCQYFIKQTTVLYSLFNFALSPHQRTLLYVCLLELASNQHSQALFLNELHHVIFSCVPPFHSVSKTKSCGKKWRLMICTGSFGATVPPAPRGEVAWLPGATFWFPPLLVGDWNREIWCWKSILEWPHHWPLQWEVPFGMGLSFYDIVIVATARADAKFGFLEAGTQSTIIVYSFVKIWDTCPKF